MHTLPPRGRGRRNARFSGKRRGVTASQFLLGWRARLQCLLRVISCHATQSETRLLYPRKLPRQSLTGVSALGHKQTSKMPLPFTAWKPSDDGVVNGTRNCAENLHD